MTIKNLSVLVIALAAGVARSSACISASFPPPQTPGQLPADIFKVHVHIEVEPLQIEIPALGGGTTKISGKKQAADPQGDFKGMIERYEADPARHTTYGERNDYAAALLFAGRFADAVAVLVRLEADFPGKSATAYNLGTGYELTGDVPQALTWIKTGIERHAGLLEGSEWLHVAILETKLALQKDARWLETHSVLDGSSELSREKRERALELQLNERLYFIHENDPIMCDLMYQAALLTSDPAKKAYFIKQVPKFGTIRNQALKKLG